MSVIGLASLARATSPRGDWTTWMMSMTWPVVWDRSVRPTVAVVGYGVGPLTRLPLMSWKQWPAVSIHCGATSAPEQALSRVVPPGTGMFVMVSLVENRY